MNRAGGILFILVLALVGGCAVGPDYRAPDSESPDRWHHEAVHASVETDTDSVGRWWRNYGDTRLNRLVRVGVKNNLRLEEVRYRVRQARFGVDVERGGYWPALRGRGEFLRQRASENEPGPLGELARQGLADLETTRYFVAFDAGWELDLFGGTERRTEAARARLGATKARQRDLRITVTAEIVRAYVRLREARARLKWVKDLVETQRRILAIVKKRRQFDLVSPGRVARERSQLENLQSRLPPLRTREKTRIHRLSTLVGQPAGSPRDLPRKNGDLHLREVVVPVGIPSTVLRRRPDVRRAERELAEVTARIGATKAQLFPRFFLTGAVGRESTDFSNLFQQSSRLWSLGPRVEWSLFEGGRIRAELGAVRAERKAVLKRYERTILTAIEDVENALVQYGNSRVQLEHLDASTRSARRALNQQEDLSRSGLAHELTVLQNRQEWIRRSLRKVRTETAVKLAYARLIKSLGGYWGNVDPARSKARPNS